MKLQFIFEQYSPNLIFLRIFALKFERKFKKYFLCEIYQNNRKQYIKMHFFCVFISRQKRMLCRTAFVRALPQNQHRENVYK